MKRFLPLMLAAAAPLPAHAAPPDARVERIQMEVRSWGRTVSRWSIDARGDLRQTRPEPGVFNARQTVTRHVALGAAGFARMRALLRTAEGRAGHALPCTITLTDGPYGTARWIRANGRSTELAFRAPCREHASQTVVDRLFKADRQAADWAAKGEIVETKPVESGR